MKGNAMSSEKKYPRTIEEVIFGSVWPQQGIIPDPQESWRHFAILEILQTIPEDDYKKLEDRADSFRWFIPKREVLGEVYPFPANDSPESDPSSELKPPPFARVLYLSPLLEKTAWDLVVAVVAHELAHLVLDHKLRVQGDEYQIQEDQAWKLVSEWGFEREAKKHERVSKWRATREETIVRELKRKLERKQRLESKKSRGTRG